MKRILVCEDEGVIRDFVVINLKRAGYDVVDVDCGEEALRVFNEENGNFDIALLDIMMPGIDGFQVCKELRRKSSTIGIIMLSAKTQEMDKVSGLMLGADDYITKPFGTQELLARIKTAIRHTRTTSPDNQIAVTGVFRTGGLEIDYDKYRVYVDGQDTNLTQNEFKIVALLGKNAGKVLTYDYIIKQLWGPHAKTDNQILRVNMANIRRKIEKKPAEPKYIFTEVGVGYRMTDGETSKN